jgi:RimJ/RimL family protein N-acetyltransferase
MEANILRTALQEALPVSRPPLLVRNCERSDTDSLAVWPAYPKPFDSFIFSFADLAANEIDSLYRDRQDQKDRITLVVDCGSVSCIGYVALLEIDWEGRECGNMGIRVHPQWCNKGIGSTMLKAIQDWWFGSGMNCLRLDVASSNKRAVRCYEKVGFSKAKGFWREATDLKEANLADPQWRFLDGHIRTTSRVPELRFLLMELRAG